MGDVFKTHLEFASSPLKIFYDPLFVLLVVIVRARILIRLAAFEHEIDDARQLVGGGGDSNRRPMFSSDAAVECTQGTVAACQALGSQAESLVDSTVSGQGAALLDLAARDLVVRSQPEPGGEVFDRRPFAHVGADLGQDVLNGRCPQAIDGSQVDPGHAIEGLSQVEVGFVTHALFF